MKLSEFGTFDVVSIELTDLRGTFIILNFLMAGKDLFEVIAFNLASSQVVHLSANTECEKIGRMEFVKNETH